MLPSSGTLSLNDIRVELGLAQSNVSLRSMSNTAGFSTPDAVSEFYGYSSATSIFIIDNGTVSYGESCFLEGGEIELYWSGSGCPTTGNTLYENSSLTVPFNGAYKWWRSPQCSVAYYIMENGFIEGTRNCG